VLVTATNPTPAGEGKTTTSIGLADALAKSHKTILALREPSLGPVFGIKGGATGGGYAQVAPMVDINLHFTGDFHAISSAVNLLCAMLDNHIKQGNELHIDPATITLKRVVDMNDRQLRFTRDGLSGGAKEGINGIPRDDGFEITVASEVMAIFCLAKNLKDLRKKLGKIIVAYSTTGKPVTAKDLKAIGAMTALFKDAVKPNLVQTLEHTPAIIHGGQFATIAHGCNSIIATKTALGLAGDNGFVVTEAGFGADLGAEKFLDIKCYLNDIYPDAIVLVTTIRALKFNGDGDLERGLPNLEQHITNLTTNYGAPVAVTLNKFPDDTPSEIKAVKKLCSTLNLEFALSEVHTKGGAGGLELAQKVVKLSKKPKKVELAYDVRQPLVDKIRAVAVKIYRANDVTLSKKATDKLTQVEKLGANLPVCIAKTPASFSDDPAKLGTPRDFNITITDLKLSAGAGFIVAYAGAIMTMPGLPKVPSAEKIDVDENGQITGIF
jgi:formate--tetrahydrofolate ligase